MFSIGFVRSGNIFFLSFLGGAAQRKHRGWFLVPRFLVPNYCEMRESSAKASNRHSPCACCCNCNATHGVSLLYSSLFPPRPTDNNLPPSLPAPCGGKGTHTSYLVPRPSATPRPPPSPISSALTAIHNDVWVESGAFRLSGRPRKDEIIPFFFRSLAHLFS
ncbi:hypothetical protein B0H63DRAFT_148312 [Podospora didyma]|uniref:Uncharacterized protein n=1 Tax=Podospora didyma TaxID=330526 RepID=A0AAE0NSW1_9PEZI|nr:hypothetical protein B0H63DRAFT_148312 [Podospora didyma]